MSIKNDILDELKSAIEGITLAAGYNSDVKSVERYYIPDNVDTTKLPYITIHEQTEMVQVEGPTNLRLLLTVMLLAYVRIADDLEETITLLTDDIKKLINGPPDLGAYCLSINYIGQEIHEISKENERAAVQIGIELIYYAPKAGF